MNKYFYFLIHTLICLSFRPVWAQGLIDKKLAGQVVFKTEQSMKIAGKLSVKAFLDKEGQNLVAETQINKVNMPQLFLLGPNNLVDRNKEWQGPFYVQAFYNGEQILNTGAKSQVVKKSQMEGPLKGGERQLNLKLE